ncbi:MAG: prephenate dehydratase [Galactobacter sp.]|uniref:prephenate dehydratase n=1 Tax=Galactobacter sp. TaxID=2676125 RepID=UPI0025C4D5DD|nr:prephenate dehydratase [Galactobacter sp.]
MTYTFLGPAGTFCESALLTLPDAVREERVPSTSVDTALAAVRSGEFEAAMVPIENSVEGGVSATLDAIATGDALQIIAEAVIPVTFQLVAREGITSLDQVRTISTHSHAWAQCRGWAEKTIPGVEFLPASSTAAGAMGLLDAECGYDAALCNPLAAELTGLDVLAEGVEDHAGAVTRFVLVRKPGKIPAATGSDKSTVVITPTVDHPGGLRELLDQFATRGVNLTRIESRPTGTSLGQYFFSMDLEGHLGEPRIADALAGAHRIAADVRFLGSYPSATPLSSPVPVHASAEAYAAAGEWIRRLKHVASGEA